MPIVNVKKLFIFTELGWLSQIARYKISSYYPYSRLRVQTRTMAFIFEKKRGNFGVRKCMCRSCFLFCTCAQSSRFQFLSKLVSQPGRHAGMCKHNLHVQCPYMHVPAKLRVLLEHTSWTDLLICSCIRQLCIVLRRHEVVQ